MVTEETLWSNTRAFRSFHGVQTASKTSESKPFLDSVWTVEALLFGRPPVNERVIMVWQVGLEATSVEDAMPDLPCIHAVHGDVV
jgi:hypothetical protein